ncbi:MAG: glutathione S-transferase family protein [Bermanella sp.]
MTNPTTIYFNPMTVNSIKTSLLVNALNIPVQFEHVVLHKPNAKSEIFLTLNPTGKVPVLVDEDMVLTESNAILKYLANKHNSLLWPNDSLEQAQVLKWMFFQGGDWNKTVGIFSHRRVVLPHWGFHQKHLLSTEQLQSFHNIMQQLENALEDRNVLVGNDITIADISLGSYLIFAHESQMPLENFANVRRWLNHLQKTAWWQETQLSLKLLLNSSESCPA